MSEARGRSAPKPSRSFGSLSKAWDVSTRKNAARWADSILPPSPRFNAGQESGHLTSYGRKPVIDRKMVPNPPPQDVQPSDKQLSPRGWFFERPGASSGSSFKRTGAPGVSVQEQMQFEKAERAREYRRRARAKLAARNARREMGWDPAPHRTMPAILSGIKPVTEEPWSRDARVYAHKFGSFEWMPNVHMDGTKLEEYNDESILDTDQGYEVKVTASGLAGKKGQSTWDGSSFRPCPFVLRGIRPVTREPWVYDEKVYNRNTTRDTTDDERAGGGALELGSISHATRAKSRQVDRPGFYAPNWEKWSASLSA